MRKFLVILDDTRECLNAMRFAAMRASKTGGGVVILAVITQEFRGHWIGVGDIMREEAEEGIRAHFEVFAQWMRGRQGIDPELVIREGEPAAQIFAQLEEDPEIGVLVLGAGEGSGGPGPLVSLLSARAANLPVPMTIVPGSLSKDALDQIT